MEAEPSLVGVLELRPAANPIARLQSLGHRGMTPTITVRRIP
jgi:hypothetical protein